MEEIWKDVPDYEGLYEVSDLGRIRNKKGLIKKQFLSDKGYLKVELYKNGKSKKLRVHRLVAQAFIENQFNKNEVNHKNGIKIDNFVDNLEWMTTQENLQHAFENGLKYKKISDEDVKFIKENYKSGDKIFGRKAFSEKFGVSVRYINTIVSGRAR